MELKIARNRKFWRIASLAAWKQEDCAKAKTQLEAALEKSESFSRKDLRLAVTLANLAQIYHSENREEEAKRVLQQAQSTLYDMPIALRSTGYTWRERNAIHDLVLLYREQHKSDPAKQRCYAHVIETLEALAKNLSPSRSTVDIYERALAIRERALGLTHVLVAQSLETLVSNMDDPKTDRPEKLLERALKIREEAQGQDHADVARLLEELAEHFYLGVSYYANRHDKAVLAYQRALAIKERVLGLEHPALSSLQRNLAFSHQALSDYDSAQPLFERALEIREKALGLEHHEVVQDHYALADLYRAQNKPRKAEVLLKRALAIQENLQGSQHSEVAASLDILAWLYDTEKEFDKAGPLLKRALEIREKTLGTESYEVAQSLEELAGLRIAKGHSSDAKPLLERALAIREKVDDIEPPVVADRHIERTWVTNLNPLTHHDAEPLLKRAIAIREVAFGTEHWRVAETLKDYAFILRHRGRIREAEKLKARIKAIWAQHAEKNGIN